MQCPDFNPPLFTDWVSFVPKSKLEPPPFFFSRTLSVLLLMTIESLIWCLFGCQTSDLLKYPQASCIYKYGNAADFYYIWLYIRICLISIMYNINQMLHDGFYYWRMNCYPFRSTWVHPVSFVVNLSIDHCLYFDFLLLVTSLVSSHFSYKILSIWTSTYRFSFSCPWVTIFLHSIVLNYKF